MELCNSCGDFIPSEGYCSSCKKLQEDIKKKKIEKEKEEKKNG